MAKMKFYDAKRQGLCTNCCTRPAMSKRGLLCDVCLSEVAKRHEEESKRPG